MSELKQIVTIDGPAGVGKSTVSREVASILGYTYLDTGAMYRGVAVYLLGTGIASDKEIEAITDALGGLQMRLLAPNDRGEAGVLVNGVDVSEKIRSSEISMAASRFSAIPVVRQKLTHLQQELGQAGKIVAEGRDMGTVVFPDAAYKFFLDAQPAIRAHRRSLQLQAKGELVDEAEILRQTIERDKNDRERSVAPLRAAADARVIDTGEIEAKEVVRLILSSIC